MSFLSFLGLGRRASPLSRPPTQRLYVVDATALVDARLRNGSGQPSPRDHFFVLRNLAQFAGRERITLTAVFMGRPLREAGEGGQYKGVKVHYAEHAEARADKLIRLVRESLRGRDVILITGDADLERQAMALNAACMRPSTLKKAMEDRDDRGDRGDREERPFRSNRGRPPMDRRQEPERRPEVERSERPPEPGRPPEAERSPSPRPSAAPEPPEKPAPGVLDLIDPV